MTEPEARCLERFQSLLEIQIEKARAKAIQEPVKEEEEDAEAGVNDCPQGSRERVANKESVLLPPFGSRLRLKTPARLPRLWKEAAPGFAEQGHSKQGSGLCRKVLQCPDTVGENSSGHSSEDAFPSWSPASSSSHPGLSPCPSPLKRKAPISQPASDADHDTLSPQKIFIIPAPGQDHEQHSAAPSCPEEALSTGVLDTRGALQSSGYDPQEEEEEEEEESKPSARIEIRKHSVRKAFHLAASLNGGESSAGRQPQAPAFWSSDFSEAGTPASTTRGITSLPVSKDDLHQRGIATPDCTGAQQLSKASVTSSAAPASESSPFQEGNTSPLRDDFTLTEKGADDNNNTCHEQPPRKHNFDTERGNVRGSNVPCKAKEINQNGNNEDVTPHDTELAEERSSDERSPVIPEEDCDYDCDFICRLLSPVRSARGRGQVSLFQEIQQAEHGERQDTRTVYEDTKGRLPHPPLRMLPPHSAITADDSEDCLLADTESTLLSHKSGCPQYTTEENMGELASYSGLEFHNNGLIPSPVACSQSLQDVSPPAVCQNDNHHQDEEMTSLQSLRQGIVMPFPSSHDILDFEHADTSDYTARKTREEAIPEEETLISTDSGLVHSNSPPPVIDDYVHTQASLSGTIFTSSSAHATRLAGILQLSLNKSYFLLSMKNAAPTESLLEDSSGFVADDLVIPPVGNTTDNTDVTPDSLLPSQYLTSGKCRQGVSCELSHLGWIKEEKTHILNSLSTAYVCQSMVSGNRDFTDRRVVYQRSGCQQSETQLAHSLLTLNNNSLPSHRKRRGSDSSRSELAEEVSQSDDGYLLEYSFTHRPRPSPNLCEINHKKSRKSTEPGHDVSSSGHQRRSNKPKGPELSTSSLPLFGNSKKPPNPSSNFHPDDCKCLDYDCLRKRGEMLHNHVMKNLDVLKLFAGHHADKRPKFRVQIKEAVGNKAREMIKKQKALLAESPKETFSLKKYPQEQRSATKHKTHHVSSVPSRRHMDNFSDRGSSGQKETDARHSAMKGSKYTSGKQNRTKPPKLVHSLLQSSRCLPEGQKTAAGFNSALENSFRSFKSPSTLSQSTNSIARSSKRDAPSCRRKKRFQHAMATSEKSPPFSRQLARDAFDPLYALRQSNESCERLIHQLKDNEKTIPPWHLGGKRGWDSVANSKSARRSAATTDTKYRLPSSAVISTPNEQNPSAYFFSVEVPRIHSSDHRHFLFPSEKCTELCCETKHTIMRSGQKTVTKECEKRLYNPSTKGSASYYYSMSQELEDGKRIDHPDMKLSTTEKDQSHRSDDKEHNCVSASTERQIEPDKRERMASITTADKQDPNTLSDSKLSIGINQGNNATIVKSPDSIKPCDVEDDSTYYSQKEAKDFCTGENQTVTKMQKTRTVSNPSYTVSSKYVYQHSLSKSSSTITESTIESDHSIIRMSEEGDRAVPPSPEKAKGSQYRSRKDKKHRTAGQTENAPAASPVVKHSCQEKKKQNPAEQTEKAPGDSPVTKGKSQEAKKENVAEQTEKAPADSLATKRKSLEDKKQCFAEPVEAALAESPATEQQSHAEPALDEAPKDPPVTSDAKELKTDSASSNKSENPESKSHTHSSGSSYFKNTISVCSSSCTFATPGVRALEIPCLSKPARHVRDNKYTSHQRKKSEKTWSGRTASVTKSDDKADEDMSESLPDHTARISKAERRRDRRRHNPDAQSDKSEAASASTQGGSPFDFSPSQFLPKQLSLPGAGALDRLSTFSQWFGSRGAGPRQSASMPVGDLRQKHYEDLTPLQKGRESTSPDSTAVGARSSGTGSDTEHQGASEGLSFNALLSRATALQGLGLVALLPGFLAALVVAFHSLLSRLPRPASGQAAPEETQGDPVTEAAKQSVTSTSSSQEDANTVGHRRMSLSDYASSGAEALDKRLDVIRQLPQTVRAYGWVVWRGLLTVLLTVLLIGAFLWGASVLLGNVSVRACIDLERLWEEVVTRLRLRHLTVPPV